MKTYLMALAALAFLTLNPTAHAQDEDLKYALQDYMEVAAFADGVITAEELKEQLNEVFIIDTRLEADYAKNHIPGAVNIDWRYIIAELDQIPQDKLVVLYCDTGILSSKAHFALRLLGYSNARVLFNGLASWETK